MNTPTTKRFRHAIGFVDADSDTEIEASATLTSEGVSIEHRAFPAKRLKTQHSIGTAMAAEAAGADSLRAKVNSEEEKKKNQVLLSNLA